MSCDFTEQVSLLIDGELPANEASRVERHVITCLECQETRADFLNLRREISDYQITLDPRAQERALAEILANRESFPRQNATLDWRERFVAAFGVPRFATAMATACALLLAGVIGFMIYRSVQRNSPSLSANTRPTLPAAPLPQPSRQPEGSVTGTVKPTEKKPGSKAPAIPRERRAPLPTALADQHPTFVAASTSTDSNGGLVSSADAETLTARHVEQSSLLLRAFRNARVEESDELSHERNRARQLLYQNILLRREATTKGNVQVASLLDSLEPILIDIANLPARPNADEVRTIQERMERKNLVPLLQVNSTQLARAFD